MIVRSQRVTPCGVVDLAAELDRDHTHDQREQNHQQREEEAGEQRRVPLRERGEHRTGRGDQPHLVAVPHRSDRVDQHPAAGVGDLGVATAAEDRQQHPHTEVEALEHEIADEQHCDENEPQFDKPHDVAPLSTRR